MKTLELECPNCGAALSLDPGFAGGVCRCSSCATLMTVPSEPAGRAEALERPEEPGAAPRAKSGGRSAKAASAGAAPPPPGQYRTASGRVVTVKAGQKVPTASKAKAAKAVTVGAFALVLLIVLGFVGAAAWVMMQPVEEVAAGPAETFVYDPDANPYEVAEPNVFGLPLSARTVVVLDLSGVSAETWEAARPLLEDAVGRSSRSIRLNVLTADGDGVEALLGRRPARLGELDADAARAALAALKPRAAGGSPLAALSAEAAALADALGADVRLDVVMLDADSAALDRLTRDRGGVYRVLDGRRELSLWQRP